jgi:tetratricopeptide (TPR) repeat protein
VAVLTRLIMAIGVCAALATPEPVLAQGKPSTKPPAAPSAKPAPRKPARKPPPAAPGVRGMFDRAQRLFDAGKYPEAIVAYDALLRKYPGHEPATIQLAKALYRLDRIKEAYGVFARVNPQHLDPETSYEFGWSFYTMKQWDGALYAFQRVPKGHALFDLANYYGGICAIRLKKYADAEDMLEKAVVLPDKLAKSRSLYIKHVQALRLLQQKSQLAAERDREKQDLKNKDRDKKGAKDATDAAAKDQPYAHKGNKSVSRHAKVKHTVEHQYIDYHGKASKTFDSQVPALDVASGIVFPLPYKLKGDRRAAIGVHLNLGFEERITRGQEERTLIDENDDDLRRLQQTDLGTTDVRSGLVGGGLWYEMPLPEDIWWALGGNIDFIYLDLERGNRYGYRKGYTGIGGAQGPFNYSSEVSYTETLDAETLPTITMTSGDVALWYNFPSKFTVRGKAIHRIYDYLVPALEISGPDAVTRGELSLKQSMPLGFAGTLLGAFEQQTNNIFYRIPTYGQLAASGQAVSAKATLSADPLPWFSASISQLLTKTTYQLDLEEARDPFELTVPSYIETFTAWASINLIF